MSTKTATGGVPASGPFWTRHLRREVQFVLDLVLLAAAFLFAYLLRFDFAIPWKFLESTLIQLPFVVLLQFVAVILAGIYSFVWRYISIGELGAFGEAALYSSLPLVLLRFVLPDRFQTWRIPLSVIVIDAIFAFGGLLAIRVLRRGLYERFERSRREQGHDGRKRPVLLVGAGRAGVLAIREIQGRGDLELEPVGFVDDDPLKRDAVIHGVRVLGTTADIPALARRLAIDRVVITIAEVDRQTITRIVDICERARIRVQIIPGLYEIIQGKVSISRFRDVEIEDLLGREQVRLDEDELERFLTAKRVMVTGAGGSIGSELARQIARFGPDRLILVERAEFALFEIERELGDLWPKLRLTSLVADVGDAARMRAILEEQRPQVVLHAAAHKHVPMMETNPGEALKNNVLATRLLARLVAETGSESFVLVSTDKAVRPSSVMGASKRLAELAVQDLQRRFPATRFLAVRFGNVMGSAGSVIPIFREQIARGGPVTVTHAEMTRYFMTIPEAAQLVLEAGAIGGPGEILILDMGEPLKILDLAKEMIRLSGYEAYQELPIVFTGLRPGEKLHEELELSGEQIGRTRHPKIFTGRISGLAPHVLERALLRLEELAREASPEAIRSFLNELLPEARLKAPGEESGEIAVPPEAQIG